VVRQAVALAREDRPGDVRLVAYVTKAAEVTDSDLRTHLRLTLPDYMLPQHFVEVPELPLTPNGKVDRKALPPPFAVAADADLFVEPRTDREKLVAEMFGKALGTTNISADDNFFAIGGHSLLSLQVVADLEERTGTRLSPRVLLLNSVSQVASQLPEPQPRGGPSRAFSAPQAAEPGYGLLVGKLLRRVKEKLRGA
jgi:acyl carrier protein